MLGGAAARSRLCAYSETLSDLWLSDDIDLSRRTLRGATTVFSIISLVWVITLRCEELSA